MDFEDTTPPPVQGQTTCQPGTTTEPFCSIYVTFAPTAPGPRYGAAELLDASGNVLATAYFQGTGESPLASFLPGVQTTIGSGLGAQFAIAVDAAGAIYFSEPTKNTVVKQAPGASAVSIGTGLSNPQGVAVDGAGNVYIADSGNQQLLKESLVNGAYVQSVIRSGIAGLKGIAVDGSGNLYVVVSQPAEVLKETLTASGYSESVIPARGLITPVGVAVDGLGNLYIADGGLKHLVKEIWSGSSYTQVSVGGGFIQPSAVAVDGGGNLYVSDHGRGAIDRDTFSTAGNMQGTLLTGLTGPNGVAVDGQGNLYIASDGGTQVLKEGFPAAPILTYGPTAVGSTTGYRTVILYNLGNQAMTLPVPSTGTNPSVATNFVVDENETSACPVVTASATPATLAAGSYCLFRIHFQPTTTGSLSGAVTLTDDSLNMTTPAYAMQSIPLQGTGKPAPAVK